jgi:hypothetical protein
MIKYHSFARTALAVALGVAALGGATAFADDDKDFGQKVEQLLKARSEQLFGVEKPVEASAPPTSGPYRNAAQSAWDQVLVAHGLKVEHLTRAAANNTDQMAFWPNDVHPTHLITCIEDFRNPAAIGTYPSGQPKLFPSVQRINLVTGAVETVLRGMSSCDGIRATAWGTVLATEERSDGGAYEILNPLATTELTLTARATNNFIDMNGNPVTGQAAYRGQLPTMAWEGLAVLPNGVVIAGDELRPGTGGNDRDGGAIFKFVPGIPRNPTSGPISDLNQSPLVSGLVYAMQVSCVNNTQQFGQGCEIGNGAWVLVNATSARTSANAAGATGYYRPEDLHEDPLYSDANNPAAVRFCWTNTGNEDAHNYGEVVCGIDAAPLVADATQRTVAVNRFIEGDTDFNSFDNLAFQPKTGNLYVIEDHDNGDIFACLPDGADRDIKTDGCVKILSVKDSSAEPTGFLFDASGTTAYVSIQHSDDSLMPLVDGYATDDVLKISGFKVKNHKNGFGWWQ